MGVPSTANQRARTSPDAQRAVDGDGVRGGALLGLRRHHPDLAQRLDRVHQRPQAVGHVAVVVRDEDARRRGGGGGHGKRWGGAILCLHPVE